MMDDNKFDGEKSSDEEPVQQFEQYIMNVEEVSQRRPVVRFGAVVVAVGIGSYFGVGRHVKSLVKTGKAVKVDLEIIRNYVSAIGEVTVADFQMREGQSAIVHQALKNGDKFKHFPGLGVWVEGKS